MAVILLPPLGANSTLVLLLVGEDLKVVHLNLFHQIVHQRWRVLVLHRQQISNDLLPVQQHQVLFQVPHLPLVVEKLFAISAKVVVKLLLKVQAGGPCC
jgi:hypothetical protein